MWGEDWATMVWGSLAQVPMMGPLSWTSLIGALVVTTVVFYRKSLVRGKTLES